MKLFFLLLLFSRTFEYYLFDDSNKVETETLSAGKNKQQYDKADKVQNIFQGQREKEDKGLNSNIKGIVIIILSMLLVLFAVHCTWVTSNAYSSPSIVLASYSSSGQRQIIDDFREAYYWLRKNTPEDARVMSWWDYGYQIAGMANRTTLVDNNTWNNSHIAMVGKAMSSNETEAYKIMNELDVDYVLVIFGGLIGYSGDDINKFLWMVRIAEGEHPNDIKESNYFTQQGEFRVDAQGSPTLLNCLMYKLSYYRFGEIQVSLHLAHFWSIFTIFFTNVLPKSLTTVHHQVMIAPETLKSVIRTSSWSTWKNPTQQSIGSSEYSK